MNEQPNVPPEGNQTGNAPKNDSWQEVGRQFQELGNSLAEAVRTSWENEETQRRLQEMRTGLESMAQQVGKAIDDTANSSQGQKVRENAGRAAENLRSATEQTVQEVRPQLITALEELNQQLQKLIDRMKRKTPPQNPPAGQPPVDPGDSSDPGI